MGDLHLGTVVINMQDMNRAGEQARHVGRLAELGATRVEQWPYPPDADFVVMRDPDGNEFCVIHHPGR
jgi:Glyoxalase-like domain